MNIQHNFYVEDASKYGVDEAIFLFNIKYWCFHNKANDKHFHDGRTWTYNSKKAYAKLFPYWSEKQIRRIINNLVKQGVILKGNYNKSPYDKTNWYALVEEETIGPIEQPDRPKRSNLLVPVGQPIPNNKPDLKPNNKYKRCVSDELGLTKNFELTDSLKQWGRDKKYYRLQDHLDYFTDYVKSRNKAYKNWQAAFRNAVRNNWANLPNEPTSREQLEAQWERMEAKDVTTQ